MTPDGRTLVFLRSSPETSFDLLSRAARRSQPCDAGRADARVRRRRAAFAGRPLARLRLERIGTQRSLCPSVSRRRNGGWQVSSDGGSQPAWNPNGKEIFYRIGDRMMAVERHAGRQRASALRAAASSSRGPYAYGAGITIANYDVTKDGQRFVMVRDDASVGRLRVILNWHPEASKEVKGRKAEGIRTLLPLSAG